MKPVRNRRLFTFDPPVPLEPGDKLVLTKISAPLKAEKNIMSLPIETEGVLTGLTWKPGHFDPLKGLDFRAVMAMETSWDEDIEA